MSRADARCRLARSGSAWKRTQKGAVLLMRNRPQAQPTVFINFSRAARRHAARSAVDLALRAIDS
jgi:hypothetical protein